MMPLKCLSYGIRLAFIVPGHVMNRLFSLLLGSLLFAGLAAAQPAAELGRIDFPNSGAPGAQDAFLRGVLLLHSFEYDDAAEAFREARAADPAFALAYWGEALTHTHPLWNQQDRDAARAVLEALAPTPEARAAKAGTDRERGYLHAVEVLYGDGDRESRDRAYAEAMRRLREAYPDDLEAAAFYALALLGTSHGGRDFRIYMKAAAVAGQVFAANPDHPGAAHYLIHSFDDPIHAPLGLPAARAYAQIAPAAAHALHMPSHIFLALGLWDDVVASNEASWAAAYTRAERKGLSIDARNYHAFWWLLYAYLQQGRYEDARQALAAMEVDTRTSGSTRTRHHLVYMRAHYLIETQRWTDDVAAMPVSLDGLSLSAVAAHHFATGLAAAEAGNLDAARAARTALAAARAAHQAPGRDAEVSAILLHELDASLALAEGREADALAHLDAAVAAEAALPFDFGPPDVVKPSYERYGEVLLSLGRPSAAQAMFAQALERAPGRARSLLGLARAADAAGDHATATHTYGALRRLWHRADKALPERQEMMVPDEPGRD